MAATYNDSTIEYSDPFTNYFGEEFIATGPVWESQDYTWDDPRLLWSGRVVTPWQLVTEPDDVWREVIE